jgi:hypothetical protein
MPTRNNAIGSNNFLIGGTLYRKLARTTSGEAQLGVRLRLRPPLPHSMLRW